jgi:hypothetical protein
VFAGRFETDLSPVGFLGANVELSGTPNLSKSIRR